MKTPKKQRAGVAELVDAADSKSAFRKEVWVRVPPPVPFTTFTLLHPLNQPGLGLLNDLGQFGNIIFQGEGGGFFFAIDFGDEF